MVRALITGSDADEIVDLARRATALFGPTCHYYGLEVDTSSTDPGLAWGMAEPVIRRLEITGVKGGDHVDGETETTVTTTGAIARPLGEDGDAAPTILDAAHHLGVNVIVAAARPQGWFARLFSGSAAEDLLVLSDIPVLMINRSPQS